MIQVYNINILTINVRHILGHFCNSETKNGLLMRECKWIELVEAISCTLIVVKNTPIIADSPENRIPCTIKLS